MKTNFILLGFASIIVILVMSAKKKEAFREGQTIRYKSVAGGNRPAANPAAFKSFMSRTRPGRGYCERNIGSLCWCLSIKLSSHEIGQNRSRNKKGLQA